MPLEFCQQQLQVGGYGLPVTVLLETVYVYCIMYGIEVCIGRSFSFVNVRRILVQVYGT